MYDIVAVHANFTGVFPTVLSRNISAPSDGLGTEFIAALVDDHWGFRQALLNNAGYADFDGVTESSTASQAYTAMQRCFGHPGEVVAWHSETDPTTLGIRLLPLEGQLDILISDYPEMVAATYVGDGNNSDAAYQGYRKFSDTGGLTPNTSGPYYRLPEMRGLFLRGIDPTNIHDPIGSVRVVPDEEDDRLEQHGHELIDTSTTYYCDFTSAGGFSGAGGAWTAESVAGSGRLQAPDSSATIIGATTSPFETRPVNAGVMWCVRY